MKTNICKFPTPSAINELEIFCFVFETDKETMRKRIVLAHDRMILIDQGEGSFLINEKAYDFSAGTLLFAFAGESLALATDTDVQYIYIDFGGTRADALFKRFAIRESARKFDKYNSVIPFCKNSLISTLPENIDIAAEAILLYVFSQISVEAATKNSTIQKILEVTEEKFQDCELSIALIAEKIGYNPKYLSHFFKKEMKIGYSEYLRSIRLKYAISLFELGISSVKNVALLSGFSDPQYFSSCFRKHVGISPSDFILGISASD